MKLGIISDSHENMPKIKNVVDIFNAEDVEQVIHAGDVVSPFTFGVFKDLKSKFIGVYGNNDGDKFALREKFAPIGEFKYSPYILDINDKKVIIMHEPLNLDLIIEYQLYDIVIYGHTHEVDIRREGKTLIINPGECGGWLHNRYTAVVLDLSTFEPKVIEI